MKKAVIFILLFLFCFLCGTLFGQSNQVIDLVLEQKTLQFSYAAYMVLAAKGDVPESSTPEAALALLSQKNWRYLKAKPDKSISLGEYSYLIMKVFSLHGG
ncbi:MAG: hypothetical protein AB1798_23215, partial [Spirochaetota bacterium]